MYNVTTFLDMSQLKPLNKEGKNSQVFTYYYEQLGKSFVAKKIEMQDLYSIYEEDFIDKLFQESKILYDTSHPHIMPIQYATYDENNIYICMPECKNGSLNALINSRFLTVREIIKYSLEFLLGLHFIHIKGLIHFDIKPTNILINDNGKAVITDFGLTKPVDMRNKACPDMIYNSHRPPESLIDDNIDFDNRYDIYQAGITMYRMCVGNVEFDNQFNNACKIGISKSIVKGIFPNRKKYPPHIPLKLQRIINKAIESDLNKRYNTVIELINELSKIDNCLDWQYKISDTIETWSILNKAGTHIDSIYLENSKDSFKIYGKKTRISDGSISNNYTFNAEFENKEKSYSYISKLIK